MAGEEGQRTRAALPSAVPELTRRRSPPGATPARLLRDGTKHATPSLVPVSPRLMLSILFQPPNEAPPRAPASTRGTGLAPCTARLPSPHSAIAKRKHHRPKWPERPGEARESEPVPGRQGGSRGGTGTSLLALLLLLLLLLHRRRPSGKCAHRCRAGRAARKRKDAGLLQRASQTASPVLCGVWPTS